MRIVTTVCADWHVSVFLSIDYYSSSSSCSKGCHLSLIFYTFKRQFGVVNVWVSFKRSIKVTVSVKLNFTAHRQQNTSKALNALVIRKSVVFSSCRLKESKLMPGFHHSVAILPLPFRRCRYVNSVRIT